ncbi:MAG: GxxExxY protein [Planctomycetes bacterium]|nr:GxxExxY protein [Planctomycetota bacterium]
MSEAIPQYLNDLATLVIGAAIEVHRELGSGSPEVVYQRALAVELNSRGIAFQREHIVKVAYKGHDVGEGRLDFLVENTLVIELKTVEVITNVHVGQVIAYLRATANRLGIVINFNSAYLKGSAIKRVVL